MKHTDPPTSHKDAHLVASIGAVIQAQRTARGMSLRTLAAKTGVTASFLSQVEHGKSNVSLQGLFAIADALGLPIHTLLYGQELNFGVRHKNSQRAQNKFQHQDPEGTEQAATTTSTPATPPTPVPAAPPTPVPAALEQQIFTVIGDQCPTISLPERGVTTQLRTPNMGRGLEVLLSSGSKEHGNIARQLGITKRETIFVLEGSVRVTIAGTTSILGVRDSIYFCAIELDEFICETESATWLSIIAYEEFTPHD